MKHLSAIISAMVLSISANAADITFDPAKPSDPRNVMLISGEIVKGDYTKFKNIITNVSNDKPFLILLDGPGGSLSEAIQIGLAVNKLRYDTVAYKDICASACAYIWLAGERAIIDIDQNAKVGFHSPYYTDKFGNKKSDNSASAILGGYLRDIGAGYSVITYATSVDGNGIRWLTESHAKEMGLEAVFLTTKNKEVPLNNLPTKTFNFSDSTLTVPVNNQNRAHGVGLYKMNNSATQSTTFVNGLIHGPAVYTFANGDKVFFNYVNGKKQGEVKKQLTNGTTEIWTVVDGSSKGQSWTRFDTEGKIIASGIFQ